MACMRCSRQHLFSRQDEHLPLTWLSLVLEIRSKIRSTMNRSMCEIATNSVIQQLIWWSDSSSFAATIDEISYTVHEFVWNYTYHRLGFHFFAKERSSRGNTDVNYWTLPNTEKQANSQSVKWSPAREAFDALQDKNHWQTISEEGAKLSHVSLPSPRAMIDSSSDRAAASCDIRKAMFSQSVVVHWSYRLTAIFGCVKLWRRDRRWGKLRLH